MASHDAWVFRQGVLWSAELNKPQDRPIAAKVPAKFGQLQPGSFAQLIDAVGRMDPITPAALASRLEAGRQCFAGWVSDSVAAYGWLTRGPEWVGEFERELNVLQGEAYIWDCATVPEHRRQRLFSGLIAHVANQLRHEGLHRLWIIATINTPSMNRNVVAAGFAPILNLTYVRLYDKRFLLAMPAAGTSSHDIAAGRRLLKDQAEQALGPLIVGNTKRPVPPEMHFDR